MTRHLSSSLLQLPQKEVLEAPGGRGLGGQPLQTSHRFSLEVQEGATYLRRGGPKIWTSS